MRKADGRRPYTGGFLRRVLDFVPVRLVVEGAVCSTAVVAVMISQSRHGGVRATAAYGIASQTLRIIALCGLILSAYVLIVRGVERRWAAEATPDPGATLLGIIVGFGLFCAVYLILAVVGVATWVGIGSAAALPAALLMALLAAVGEEIVFRGVLFRLLEDGLGTTAALILTAVMFGALHARNPGASYLSTLAVGLEAGVLLATAYAWNRSLWLVIGLHFAWNFTEGGIFGAAVSGTTMRGLLNVTLSKAAPDVLTGGAFGPEGSVVAVVVCLAAATAFATAASRVGRWYPWRFRLFAD